MSQLLPRIHGICELVAEDHCGVAESGLSYLSAVLSVNANRLFIFHARDVGVVC